MFCVWNKKEKSTDEMSTALKHTEQLPSCHKYQPLKCIVKKGGEGE
jgi:hypothetical protein